MGAAPRGIEEGRASAGRGPQGARRLMTVSARRAERQMQQQRGFPISQGGWGGYTGDPPATPQPSAFNMGTAGVIVNERTVLSLMVVSTCIRVLGDAVAGLRPRGCAAKRRRP